MKDANVFDVSATSAKTRHERVIASKSYGVSVGR